jgi:hypothetical protein
MMGREIKRVALDFDWPLNKVYEGFLLPERLHEEKCPACENGYSAHAQHLNALWYGYVPFDPRSTGSTPLQYDTPAVRAFAERNLAHSPDYYGTGFVARDREAQRLANLWNGMWSHHLAQVDVDALVEGHRLHDFTHVWVKGDGWQKIDPPVTPTAAQVNEWSLSGFGHDSINASVAIRARCEREGAEVECPQCQGHASTEAYPGQRAEAEAWEPTEPPTGDGWQLWETTSEGSPISPVFATSDELAVWMSRNPCGFAHATFDLETAMRWVHGSGWSPSMIGGPTGLVDGITGLAHVG